MKCRAIHKNLIFYLEGDLKKEEMSGVELHLNECRECAAFAEEMKMTLGIIENEKNAEVNPYFYTRVKAKLESFAQAQQVKTLKPAYIRVLQPVFFSMVLLMGISAGIMIGNAPSRYEARMVISVEGLVPFLDEMSHEPIETFIFEQDGNE